MDLDAYFAHHKNAPPGDMPTPVVVTVNGQPAVRSLSSVLYGPAPPESPRRLEKRMADLIARRVSTAGNVTQDDLLAGGFDRIEIERHFRPALRRSGVVALGVDL